MAVYRFTVECQGHQVIDDRAKRLCGLYKYSTDGFCSFFALLAIFQLVPMVWQMYQQCSSIRRVKYNYKEF